MGVLRTAILALVVLASAAAAVAQPPRVPARDKYLLGGIVGYQGNFYSGNFNIFAGGPQCGVFDHGSGWRELGGLTAEMPISGKLSLAPRFLYDNRSGEFVTQHEDNDVLLNGAPTQATIEHHLETTLRQLSLDMYLKWMPFAKNNMFFIAGPTFSAILQANYHQYETILDPYNAVFKFTGTPDEEIGSGSFTNVATFQMGLGVGAGYDLPVSKRTFIAPEISTVFGLTSVTKDVSWTIVSLRFAVAVKTDLTELVRGSTPATAETLEVQQRPVDKSAELPTSTLSIVGIGPDGDQIPHPTLRVEEFQSTDLQPLLPYIFFDKGSADLPPRYTRLTPQEAPTFSDTALMGSETLALYYETLNIVGARMLTHPDAVLTITGCTDNTAEAGNIDLSKRRADVVRDYLAHAFHLAPQRLTVRARGLSEHPSRQGEEFGDAENRRVELTCTDPDVIQPITQSGLERQASPPRVRLFTSTHNETIVASWDAQAIADGKVVAATGGTGAPPPSYDWVLQRYADTLIHAEQQLTFRLRLRDSLGRESATETTIPLRALTLRTKRETRMEDKRIDKFSLFLFDYDQAVLTPASEHILEAVERIVQPTSTVYVIGFTDRTGEAQHNVELSRARAQVVAEHIGAHVPGATIHGEGRGFSQILFDNATPEGRYFCRTTYVRVETPVK